MKNKLIKTQVIIMILIILGKTVGFLRESILAAKYGTGYEVDVYSYSITILLFLATIGYSITTTIIPIFTEMKEKENIIYQEKIANNLISISILVGFLISITSVIFSKMIVLVFAPGFTGETLEVARKLIMIMNFSIVAILVQSVITGILQANNEFYAPAAMALVGNVITVIYLLFLIDKFGIIGFAIVTVIAYFIQLLINIPSYRKIKFKYYFYIDISDKKVREILKLSIPILASSCIMQASTLINVFYGSLMGTGSISIYNYSNRIISLGIEIFAVGISMVIYPMLSSMSTNKKDNEFNKSLCDGLVLMSILIIPISVLLFVLREDVVRLLYERNEFTVQSTIITSKMLLLLIPTMIAAGLRDLLNKASYSLKEVNLPMKISILIIILTIVINSCLYKKIGVMSLGISTSLSNIIGTLMTLILLRRKYNFIKLNIKISLFKVTVASFLVGVVVFFIRRILINNLDASLISNLIIIFTCGISGVIIYIAILLILRIKEFKLIKGKKE